MKGKSVQYHSNVSKDEGRIFYDKFIALCEVQLKLQLFSTFLPKISCNDSCPCKVICYNVLCNERKGTLDYSIKLTNFMFTTVTECVSLLVFLDVQHFTFFPLKSHYCRFDTNTII